MEYKNTDDSFITINSIKKAEGRKLLVNNEINFKSKYNYLKPKLPVLSQKQLIDLVLNDKSWQIRRLALRRIKDANIVFQIAFNDKSAHIREYFLINFNKNALRHIALTDPSVNVRKNAIKYITDLSLLKYIALNDSSKTVRSKAAKKIKNQDFLKELIESDIDTSIKLDIIKEIDDDNYLFNLFKKTNSYNIKFEIIENLKNQEYKFELYKLSEGYLREKLIFRFDVNDTDMLLKAFKYETNSSLKQKIFYRIKRKGAFKEIFLIDETHQFSSKAIKHVYNQEILFKAIYEDYDMQTKLNAVGNLNQENLFKIYNDLSLDEYLRKKALLNIENDDYLIELCKKTQDISVILSALSNIDNQEFIHDFGVKHENWKVRSLAIAKIKDEDVLFDIALNDECWFSRNIAVKKMDNDAKLVQILLKEKNYHVQKSIVNSIKNPEILLKLFELGYLKHIEISLIERFHKNDDILTYIALNHELKSFRIEAVQLIENEETLKNIFLNDKSLDVQLSALVENNKKYKNASSNNYYFEPTLRFLDDDTFYEFLINMEQNDYRYIISIIGEITNNIQNHLYLKNLALNAKNLHVRSHAIASDNFDTELNFSDDELINCISTVFEAQGNKYPKFNGIQNSLLSKVQDELELLNFILNYSKKDKTNQILYDALNHITNEEFLYEIVYCNHLELSMKTIAVEGITNQKMVEEIVLNHPNVYVRNQTIKNVKDKNIIKYLALNDPSHIIRKSALMWNKYDYTVRSWCIEYERVGDSKVIISNEETLEEILLKSDDKRIRNIAFSMIHDEKRIIRIAKKSRDYEIRNKAAQSIKNQDVLMKIALNDSSRIVKTTAIDSIDESNLIKIINDFKDWYIRDYSLKQINDESTITDFAFNDSNWHVRHTAVSKIHDENILKEIALTDNNINIRKVAIGKIRSKDILKGILSKTTHYTTSDIVKGVLK